MTIDPVLQQVLEAVPLERISDIGPQRMREMYAQRVAALPVSIELPRVEDRTIAGVGARIYWPVPDPDGAPVVVFYHGGGWTIGDLDTHDGLARATAAQSGAIVIAVDYRLAPEYPFPAAVDDAFAALRWVGEHATELGGDPDRLAVAGDSAGGNLAAVVALLARDAGGPPLRFQLLWYPATTLDPDVPSMVENADAPVLSAADTEAFTGYYLGGHDRSEQPFTLAPAGADSHAGLPPAYIATAGHDPIRDHGAGYAELLRAAGVPVEYRNHEELVHGYLAFAEFVPAAKAALGESLAALKAAL